MILYKPTTGHAGDTFRELLDMWEESGYCTTETSPDRYVWVNRPGTIMLYDYPRLDIAPISKFEFGLFGNTVPPKEQATDQHGPCWPPTTSWIFWSRRPRMLEAEIARGIPPYKEREISSIFLGKVENNIQLQNRTQHDWSECVELFSMPVVLGNASHYPYTQEEYLQKVKSSKFGLTLPGYGPKCNREVEYFGLGTVPIYTEGCCTNFYDPIEEGVHYLFASTPDDVVELIENTTEEQWNEMSKNGREWYERNCSRKGSFDTTMRIIENIKANDE
jgi:hypothetical protein